MLKWRRYHKPLRYLGGELNSSLVRGKKVKWLLVFPDLYEIGMSSFGFQLLYFLINSAEESLCDRLFAPGIDFLKGVLSGEEKLLSLELKEEPENFHIVGFSLSSELHFPTAIYLMKLMKRKIKEDRTPFPIFIAGGPATINPAPLSPYFDAIFVGEGEEAVIQVNGIVKDAIRFGGSKGELLKQLACVEGFYVPSVHGTGSHMSPPPVKVKRRVIKDVDSAFHPEKLLVPLTSVVHERVSVEVARGCPRGCRFCLATYVYRPLRERSPETVERLAKNMYLSTGYSEISLLSLSTGDYSALEEVVERLWPFCMERSISLALPSIRINTLTENVLRKIATLGHRGMTVAPEGGSERVRRIINKVFTDDEVVEQVLLGLEHGWPRVKMYFMIGLPGESEDDVLQIAELSKRILSEARRIRRRVSITISVSPFVPKPHTPFQWFKQDFDDVRRKIKLLRRNLRLQGIKFQWHALIHSQIESFFARAGYSAHFLLEEAVKGGAYLITWRENLNAGEWKELLSKYNDYTYEGGDASDVLPWDIVDTGVRKDFLKAEYLRAMSGKKGVECTTEACRACGVCGDEISLKRVRLKGGEKTEKGQIEIKPDTCSLKMRIKFSRVFPASFMSSSEVINAFHRAMRRAELPIRFRGAFNPRPSLSAGPALPVGVESLEEYLDVELRETVPAEKVKTALNTELARSGIRILECSEIPPGTPSIQSATISSVYRIKCKNGEIFEKVTQAVKNLNGNIINLDEAGGTLDVELFSGASEIIKILENEGQFVDILSDIEILKVKNKLKS